jgi:predicted RecB family nuclease
MPAFLSPSSITRLYEPSECGRRTWLRDVAKLEPAAESDFERFIKDQGIRHESRVVEGLKADGFSVIDIEGFENENACADTVAAVQAGGNVVYQAMLETTTEIDGQGVRIFGYPDFLIPNRDGWVVADAKLTRSVHKSDGTERSDKQAILLQLRLYGWLFEQCFPGVPYTLRVYNGAGGEEAIKPDGGASALLELGRVVQIGSLTEEPVELVGWSKCGPCGYKDHCWPIAEEQKALGLVVDIDKRLAPKLEAEGITSYPEVLEKLDAAELAKLKSKKGDNISGARKILENIEALMSGEPVRRKDDDGNPVPVNPAVTETDRYVMFDLEGLPPELDEDKRVYLWGMQVFHASGEKGEFIDCLAEFGEDGDERGWEEFLRQARALIDEHGDIHFVHWAHYEKTMIKAYIERYGDDEQGTAAKVLELLLDLLPITRDSVALPLPSYSLKVVEQSDAVSAVTGFKRTADDVAKGDESIVAYMEAVETDDMSRREEIVDAICAYNQEDLEATWAVQKWLRSL